MPTPEKSKTHFHCRSQHLCPHHVRLQQPGASLEQRYHLLDKECRRQCKLLLRKMEGNKELQSKASHYKPRTPKEHKYALCLAIKEFPLLDLLKNKDLYDTLYAYNAKAGTPHGNFTILDEITSGDHVCLLSGYLEVAGEKVPAVLKYYRSAKRTIDHEIDCYKRLGATGCEIPWMSSSYRILGEKVMVMERLYKLSEEVNGPDHPEQIGIEVLEQLKYLHKFGVHSDLKPGNIMARQKKFDYYIAGRNPQECFKYFIIDHGGTATEPLGQGYKRFTWNPKFTSQKKGEKNQVCYRYHDLLELGYTLSYLDSKRKGRKNINFKLNYEDKFKAYMNEVLKYEHQPYEVPDDIYDRLISILQT